MQMIYVCVVQVAEWSVHCSGGGGGGCGARRSFSIHLPAFGRFIMVPYQAYRLEILQTT